jgi:polysaccharide biosynthesis protein PslE
MLNRNVTGNTLRDVCRRLLRHWRKSAAFFFVVVGAVAAFTLSSPKEYRSEAKLFLRLGRENATLDPTATLGQNPTVTVPLSRENEINSVVEILQSRVLFEKVVDSLGPNAILNVVDSDAANDPDFTANTAVPAESAGVPAAERFIGSAGLTSDPNTASDDAVSEQPASGWIQRAGAEIGHVFAGGMSMVNQFSSSAGLDNREKAILLLAKKVKVDAGKKSNVIEIVYEGPTPAQCQSVVATLIDSFLDEHLRLNRTQGSHEFLADQTRRLREDLSRKEAGLRDLKNQTGLASPGAQRQLLVARIGRLEDDLLSAESARAVAEAKVRDLRERLASLPDSQVTLETTGFGNEGTDRMRDQFYALQVREKEAQAKFTEDHPKMLLIRDQIATARAILDEEEHGRKQVTKEPGRLHHQAEVALLGEEPALASLQSHAEKLQTQLAGVRKELAALNENEMQFAALQREVDLLDADYRKYSANLEQSRIDQQLEVQRMSNVGIVQPASFEPRPIRPRNMTNLLLGIGLGLAGGLGLPLLLDQLAGTPPTLDRPKKQSHTRVLARVPHMPDDEHAGQLKRVPR